MKRATRPVSVAGIEFDALMSQEHDYSATVPEYATDEGYSVSDSILLGAETLSMELYLTDTPVTWYGRSGHGNDHSEQVLNRLQDLYYRKTPVTVRTTYRTYSNMAIESLKISKSSEDGFSKKVSLSFRQVRTTSVSTTTIPAEYGKSGATQAAAGSANTSSKSTGSSTPSRTTSSSTSNRSSGSNNRKGSILYNIGKSTGVIKKKKK